MLKTELIRNETQGLNKFLAAREEKQIVSIQPLVIQASPGGSPVPKVWYLVLYRAESGD